MGRLVITEGQADNVTKQAKDQTCKSKHVNGALRRHADEYDITITETVRQAIAMWVFIKDEYTAGNTIQVIDGTGHVREVRLPYR